MLNVRKLNAAQKSLFVFLIVAVCAGFGSVTRDKSEGELFNINKWFILLDYHESKDISADVINQYDMAIFDPEHHPSLDNLKDGMVLIGYLSVGEAEGYRSYWSDIKDKYWVLGPNPNWDENYIVDVRSREWQELILDNVLPDIVKKGFHGIMLDTLDTGQYLESLNADFKGAESAMVHLVKAIKKKYPKLLLISNNGFTIMERIAPSLSGILIEDIHMMVDFKNNSYERVPVQDRQWKIANIKKAQKINSLAVFNIDYVSQKNKKLIRQCIVDSHQLGFNPYVAEKDLNKIYEN